MYSPEANLLKSRTGEVVKEYYDGSRNLHQTHKGSVRLAYISGTPCTSHGTQMTEEPTFSKLVEDDLRLLQHSTKFSFCHRSKGCTANLCYLLQVSHGPQTIERWIRDISDLHQSKPAVNVIYNRPMPDIDDLMQEWPRYYSIIM